MAGSAVALWQSPAQPAVPDTLSDPERIAERALQLRDRERSQIAMNFAAGNYEIAATFIWTRTMALLKKQLSTLGPAFIGELLQRSEIDELTDIGAAVSDAEAISLARDLGILTALQTKRLLHSQAIVTHFAGASSDPREDDNEVMTREEAISCLRVCVQGVLGYDNIGVASDFRVFRERLSSETLTVESPDVVRLRSSPYFFLRTAISMLLSLIRTGKGAQLEHAARNALLIISEFWVELRAPERWQIGQSYALEFNEGRKDSIKAHHAVLTAVKGFDYVPENLRSATFTRVAGNLITVHQGLNNFYNEPAAIRELASLGTSIPSPALAACITAILCVKLGNMYGVSWNAQSIADQMMQSISKDRWIYYMDGRLDQDRIILSKLDDAKPLNRWITLIKGLGIERDDISNKKVRALIAATDLGQADKVSSVARQMYGAALAL
jgi:hypothetical protein